MALKVITRKKYSPQTFGWKKQLQQHSLYKKWNTEYTKNTKSQISFEQMHISSPSGKKCVFLRLPVLYTNPGQWEGLVDHPSQIAKQFYTKIKILNQLPSPFFSLVRLQGMYVCWAWAVSWPGSWASWWIGVKMEVP